MARDNYNMYEVEGIKIFLYKDAELTGDTVRIKLPEHVSDLANKEYEVQGLKLE